MTQQPPAIDESTVPSLGVSEQLMERSETAFLTRSNNVDTKSGLLLAAAGGLIALVGAKPSVAGGIAQVLAAIAGGFGVASLWPRVGTGIDPAGVFDRYLTTDQITTRLTLLKTRVYTHRLDLERLKVKARWFKVSAALLSAAATMILVGGIVHLITHR